MLSKTPRELLVSLLISLAAVSSAAPGVGDSDVSVNPSGPQGSGKVAVDKTTDFVERSGAGTAVVTPSKSQFSAPVSASVKLGADLPKAQVATKDATARKAELAAMVKKAAEAAAEKRADDKRASEEQAAARLAADTAKATAKADAIAAKENAAREAVAAETRRTAETRQLAEADKAAKAKLARESADARKAAAEQSRSQARVAEETRKAEAAKVEQAKLAEATAAKDAADARKIADKAAAEESRRQARAADDARKVEAAKIEQAKLAEAKAAKETAAARNAADKAAAEDSRRQARAAEETRKAEAEKAEQAKLSEIKAAKEVADARKATEKAAAEEARRQARAVEETRKSDAAKAELAKIAEVKAVKEAAEARKVADKAAADDAKIQAKVAADAEKLRIKGEQAAAEKAARDEKVAVTARAAAKAEADRKAAEIAASDVKGSAIRRAREAAEATAPLSAWGKAARDRDDNQAKAKAAMAEADEAVKAAAGEKAAMRALAQAADAKPAPAEIAQASAPMTSLDAIPAKPAADVKVAEPMAAPMTPKAKPVIAAASDSPAETPSASKAGDDAVTADSMVRSARKELQAGKKGEALKLARLAASKDNNNSEAKSMVAELDGGASAAEAVAIAAGPDAMPAPAKGDGAGPRRRRSGGKVDPGSAEAAFQKGLVAYQSGQLAAAVDYWNYSLTQDPANPGALQYLDRTRSEYDAWVQQHQYNAVQLKKEAVGSDKLETPITYDSKGQQPVSEFLKAVSVVSDINFYVAAGVDPEVKITAKFDGAPLHDVLDTVILPLGLKWSRTGDTVSVGPDLKHKVFNLNADQLARVKSLLDSKTIQRLLYGPEAVPPMRNVELLLDEAQGTLVATDSQENISKLEAFLKDLQINSPTGLVYKSFKIRPEQGQRIRALVDALIKTAGTEAYDLERKVALDGDDLIIRDTSENLAKVEALLLDKNFIRKLESQKLSVATFNLTPREPIQENLEQARDMAQHIVVVVRTILYAQSTESAAQAEGRRYFYDPNTLQLTITDYPDNLKVVADYVRSLPMLQFKDRQKSEIIFLKHQTAGDFAGLISKVLNLEDGGAGQQQAGSNSVTRTLRVNSEITFRDLRVRLRRVTSGQTRFEDQVEVSIIATGRASSQLTIEEGEAQTFDDYEIEATDVSPSGNPGEGSARLTIRYNPAGTQGGGQGGGVVGQGGAGTDPNNPNGGAARSASTRFVTGPDGRTFQTLPDGSLVPAAQTASSLQNSRVQIEAIDNMNALLVRYEDVSDLAELKGWVEVLDVPVKQVSIETKLVEVIENRAKEYMPEFSLPNSGAGSGASASGTKYNTQFGTDAGEFRSPYDPFPENNRSANLLKGGTVLNVLSGGSSPINFTLRSLESEGVLNMVNGPQVLVENGQTADFEIERQFGALVATQSGGAAGQNNNQTQTVTSLPQVRMSVSPQITEIGEIRLQIQNLELTDFGGEQGSIVSEFDTPQDGGGTLNAGAGGGGAVGGQAGGSFTSLTTDQSPDFINIDSGFTAGDRVRVSYGSTLENERRRRSLTTTARVANGGTIVLGGWTGERSRNSESGVPVLRNLPYVGKLLFNRTSDSIEKTNLLIFLTCNIIQP